VPPGSSSYPPFQGPATRRTRLPVTVAAGCAPRPIWRQMASWCIIRWFAIGPALPAPASPWFCGVWLAGGDAIPRTCHKTTLTMPLHREPGAKGRFCAMLQDTLPQKSNRFHSTRSQRCLPAQSQRRERNLTL